MSVIVRLQNLPWSAVAADIRQFFAGLSIPEGGVNIVGGELGDAFIAFSTDEDARLAMQRDGGKVKDCKVKLLLSSRTEMQRETSRQQSLQLQFLQMQQMQSQPQQPPAAALTHPPAFPIHQQQHQQHPGLLNNPGAPNMQPAMPNVQPNMYRHPESAGQPPSITPMQYPQMTNYAMATPSAANSLVTPIPPELPTPIMPFQPNQPNMQQLPSGQMPSFHTPQINQPYQMPIPQVNQSPASQAMTSHAQNMPTTGNHMAQPQQQQQQQNFLPQQQINLPPNFQQSIQQMPPAGFQAQPMNSPTPFQAGANRMSQPQQFPQNAPFQPSFPPNLPNAPSLQMPNQQGSPVPSFQSALPQTQGGSQNDPNSRLPLLQRKPENNFNQNDSIDKTERARRSRSGSAGSSGLKSQSRNRDKYPDKDRRRRNSREFRQQHGKKDRSRSRDHRSSRGRRDEDSKGGRRNDNKRSTDPKQLYKDYQNPNSSLKSPVMPASRSKNDANSKSTNVDTKSSSSKTSGNIENKESDSNSITPNLNYPDKSSQQNDQINKIESSPINKDVSSSGFSNSIDNEVSTTNPSSNSPFKTRHESKRKSANDEYNRNKGDRDDGGRRRKRGYDERFDDDRQNRMSYDEPANVRRLGFGNVKFNRFDSQYDEPNHFDYPQPPGFGWQNKYAPDCCVALRNFPISNGSEEVRNYFHDLSPEMSIKLQRNEYGFLDGALIRFANFKDKEKALERDGLKFKKTVLAVYPINDREFDDADDAISPQKEATKERMREKMLFRIERDLKSFNCLCLEGDNGVNPVFDTKNVYHEDICVVFNQINPLELFIHHGTFVHRAFVRFENHAKASSAKNLFGDLKVEYVKIRVMPCSDEQFEKFKKIVEKEESDKEADSGDRGRFQPNRRGRGRSMFPHPSSFRSRYDQNNDADHRINNRNDPPGAPSNLRIEGRKEMHDFENPISNFNSRTLLPNPPNMPPLHSTPNMNVIKSCCIIMQGLPLTVHYQDIVMFFNPVNVQPKQIHVMVDNGSPTGDAFCEFSTIEEADQAVNRNNGQLGANFVHVRLVTQEELDRAVGKGVKPEPPPHDPTLLPPPAHFDSGFRGGMRGAFNMTRGRGQFPMMLRGRGRGGFEVGSRGGRGGFESGGRGGFEGGSRGGRGGFESGGRGGYEGGTRGARGGFESGGRGGFEGGIRGGRGGFESGGRGGFEGGSRGGRGGFESGGRGGFEGSTRGGRGGFESGIRGGRGGFENGVRGGRGGFEGGVRGGRGGFEGGRGGRGGFEGGRGGRGGLEGGRGGRLLAVAERVAPALAEDELLPESSVASFGEPGCVVAAENIPFRADVNDILDLFKKYSLVAENVIRRYNDYGQATGDARIAFKTPADAEEAISLYNGKDILGRNVHLSLVR